MTLQKAYIIDTTLRDGEQTPGVSFSKSDKMEIAAQLNELGVDEVEAGTPMISEEERESIKTIANSGFSFKTSCWCRATTEDIIQAARLGTQSINISLPVSDIQIKTLGKTHRWILKQLEETVKLVKGLFPFATLGAQDASRSNRDFLREYIAMAIDLGIDRIRVADTVGLFDSIETYQFISDLKKDFPSLNLEFHGHNDFGMATANAIAALRAGVNCISGTINGLGERAGNSAIEEVIAYLSYHGLDKYKTEKLGKISRFVAERSNSIVPHQKAITGKNAFRHESGIHTSAMLKNVRSYQLLNPEDYGVNNAEFTFGKHSGKAAIISFFKWKGIILNNEEIEQISCQIKEVSSATKASISLVELFGLYQKYHYDNIVSTM